MLREICYFCLARSAAESRHGGLDVSLFFIVHLFRPLISKLTGPIFAKFPGFYDYGWGCSIGNQFFSPSGEVVMATKFCRF